MELGKKIFFPQFRSRVSWLTSCSITGMAIAATLPKHDDITIVARNLPGDQDSQEWASPWAGATWMGMADSSPRDQQVQLDAFAYWYKFALQHPESSVRRIQIIEILDYIPLEKLWYAFKVPHFRILTKDEMPADAHFGVTYETVMITPSVFLPWMRARLESSGVRFLRSTVRSLSDLQGMGHDVLINATGIGAKYLSDVQDKQVLEVRGQTALVKTTYDKVWIRRGTKAYTYCLPRGDGTAILGGIKQFGSTIKEVDVELRNDVRMIDPVSSLAQLPDKDRFSAASTRVSHRASRHLIPKTFSLCATLLASDLSVMVVCVSKNR